MHVLHAFFEVLAVHVVARQCGGQWWRRVEDGLLLREPLGVPCPQPGGSSKWVGLEVSLDGGAAAFVMTVETERDGQQFFEPVDAEMAETRFSAAGRVCTKDALQAQVDCGNIWPGADHKVASEKNGKKFCAHPEAKESRALFCRYPPVFYGHQGVCRQYSQFCTFPELESEASSDRIETAVVNVDSALFHSLESCGSLREELWIFKVFVHWCPHCQQLMPRLYRLALILQQRGVKRLRFGAVNCATEHELCSEQKWLGHPLLVARYLGPDRVIHDAIEHWVDIVKDAQLRQMLPRYALPGEYPLLETLFENLPDDLAPREVWKPLFDSDAESGTANGACPNVTEMHLQIPERAEESIGNGWSDFEAEITVKRRWGDALLMIRHALQEWIVPLGDDGNVEAFSRSQVEALEAFAGLLAGNLPESLGLSGAFMELRRLLRSRLREAQGDGRGLCADEWRTWAKAVVDRVEDVGRRDFAVPSACVSDTCRLWILLHTVAAEGLVAGQGSRRASSGAVVFGPTELLMAAKGFIDHFFKCMSCRRHFLEQFDAGLFGLGLARTDAAEAVLFFWRMHNAVSVRVSTEHACEDVDRRWPPLSLCPKCWDLGSAIEWQVLSEGADVGLSANVPATTGKQNRALRLGAQPNELEILRFLMASFAGKIVDEQVLGHNQDESDAGSA